MTEERVTAAVVEVQMAVGHVRDLIQMGAYGLQRAPHIASSGTVVSVDIGIGTHSRVE